MEIKDIQRYLSQKESIGIEFKKSRKALPENVFDTVCAFLNNKGGIIILGADDNGNITGINETKLDNIEHDLITQSNNKEKLNPPFILYPEKFTINDKHIIAVRVPVSSQVHTHKGIIYDRSGDADLKIVDNNQKNDLYNRKRNHFTENEIYPYLKEKHLKIELIEKARNLIYSNKPDHPWLKLNNKQLFRIAGLFATDLKTGKEGYTLAAALLFAQDEIIRQIVPQYRIDAMVRIENTNRYDDRIVIETNLIDAYELLMDFVAKHFNDKFFMIGTQRISLRDKIFRELIANMIVHREYTNSYAANFIIYNNRVEFKNANNPKDYKQLFIGNFEPYQKNPNIARFYRAIGRGEEIGSGVVNVNRYLELYQKNTSVEFLEDTIFRAKMNIISAYKSKIIKPKKNNEISVSKLFYKLIEIKSQNNNINLNDILINFSKNDPVKNQNDPIKNQNDPIKNQNDPIKITLTTKRKDRLLQILLMIFNNKNIKRNNLAKKTNVSEIIIKRDMKILKDFDLIYYTGSLKSGNYQINKELQNFITKHNLTK